MVLRVSLAQILKLKQNSHHPTQVTIDRIGLDLHITICFDPEYRKLQVALVVRNPWPSKRCSELKTPFWKICWGPETEISRPEISCDTSVCQDYSKLFGGWIREFVKNIYQFIGNCENVRSR